MTRKNIFETIKAKYNISKEMNKLVSLFSVPQIYYTDYDTYLTPITSSLTIEELCDKELIFQWKQRSTCLSCQEIKDLIDFPEHFSDTTSIDIIISCLEYYHNILYLLNKMNSKYEYYKKPMRFIVDNIVAITEHLHYKRCINKEEEKVILVPKNPAATAVAEISSEEIAFAILKYNHASLKGQLEEKRKLLVSLANEYEPLLEKPVEGFKDYFAKTTGLLNNLNIRHNNTAGKNKNEIVAKMSPEELESWYDELYQLLLFCVLCKDNYERKGRVSELLKNLKTELKAK